MKRFFLLTLMTVCFVTNSVMAQTTSTSSSQNSSFDKFYERLKISYFGAYHGSSLGEWDALANDEAGKKFENYAHNLWNQLSFNYNYGAKLSFVFNPRWTLNTGSTSGHSYTNNTLIVLEDLFVGFQGTLFSSEDKAYSFWARMGARLPTSRDSRAKDITAQPEILTLQTYDFNKTWQVGLYALLRHWVYEYEYTAYRYRLFFSPYVQYAFNDTTRLQAYYENYSENRARLKSENGQEHALKNYWQNVMVGISHDVTQKFNIFPFIGYHVNAKYISEKPLNAAWLGGQISYTFK